MAYKDKEKQKREWVRQKRAKVKGSTELNPLGLADSEMQHVAQGSHTINTGEYKPVNELAVGEFNRVSLPGDADYAGQLTSK